MNIVYTLRYQDQHYLYTERQAKWTPPSSYSLRYASSSEPRRKRVFHAALVVLVLVVVAAELTFQVRDIKFAEKSIYIILVDM